MFDDFQKTTWEIEEVILGMADIVMECRQLRKENEELRKYRELYYESVSARAKDADMHSANLLKLAIAYNTKIITKEAPTNDGTENA